MLFFVPQVSELGGRSGGSAWLGSPWRVHLLWHSSHGHPGQGAYAGPEIPAGEYTGPPPACRANSLQRASPKPPFPQPMREANGFSVPESSTELSPPRLRGQIILITLLDEGEGRGFKSCSNILSSNLEYCVLLWQPEQCLSVALSNRWFRAEAKAITLQR